ncbi:RnfH family protein [Celerinatantimonas sp. YJH-8]|uniref:RnfH family protein n=1 Tax=Celerinatantimonas sp. YJH-8 TaxID=3228714 RepID=UPI0038C0832B
MSQLNVEVIYALPDKQTLLSVSVPEETTVGQTIELSGMYQHYPELRERSLKVGIFSRPVKLTDPVQNGDRVEIYRPLLADPKELRKIRAERAKAKAK